MEQIENGLFVTPMEELVSISWEILTHSHSETKQLNRRSKNGN